MAAKLRPLMTDKIDRWMRARERVDANFRGMIDRQITSHYRRVAGQHRLPLLSLPPKSAVGGRGKVKIGRIEYAGPQDEAVLREPDLLRHTAIFGASGAGKTNSVLYLVQQLVDKGVPVLFFDWKRTGRRLVKALQPKIYTAGREVAPLPFNPFLPPPGTEPRVHAQQTVDLLAEAFTLGDGARSLIQRALNAELVAYSEGCKVDRLIQGVQELADNPRAKQWAVTAERVLGEVGFSGTAETSLEEQNRFIKSLERGATFIELDALSLPVRSFLATSLTSWLYRSRLNTTARDKLELMLVFEEAHHLLHQREASKPSQLETLMRLMREIGLGVVLVDQTPSRISGVALANTFTTICLNLKHPADVQRAASVLGLPPEEKAVLMELPVGCAAVRLAERWNQPFLVRTPPVLLASASMSDAQLARYFREFGASGGGPPENAVEGAAASRVPRGPPEDGERRLGELQGNPALLQVLSPRELDLVEDVLTHPDDGVKQRYLRLGWSVGAGHRLKTRLIRAGQLKEAVIPFGHTRRTVLGLTPRLRNTIGADHRLKNSSGVGGGGEEGSMVHRYWQRWWAQRYQSMGYRVQIEAPRHGGRVDVLAVEASTNQSSPKRIGIEIETGKSDVVSNVKNGLRSGFDRVIVAAVDTPALTQVEQQLAAAGLLGLSQIQVVRCDRPL